MKLFEFVVGFWIQGRAAHQRRPSHCSNLRAHCVRPETMMLSFSRLFKNNHQHHRHQGDVGGMVAGPKGNLEKNYGETPKECRHNSGRFPWRSLLVSVGFLVGLAHMRHSTPSYPSPSNPFRKGTLELRCLFEWVGGMRVCVRLRRVPREAQTKKPLEFRNQLSNGLRADCHFGSSGNRRTRVLSSVFDLDPNEC